MVQSQLSADELRQAQLRRIAEFQQQQFEKEKLRLQEKKARSMNNKRPFSV